MKPQDGTQGEERFGDKFHGIDPQSGRPFSYGVPDGIWIIASLLTINLLFGLGASLYLNFTKSAAMPWFLPGVGAASLLIPPIILLLARSVVGAYWMAFLALIVLVAGVMSVVSMIGDHNLGLLPLAKALAPVAFWIWISYYVFTLRRDRILN